MSSDYIDGRIIDRYYTIEKGNEIKLHWFLRTTEGKIVLTTHAPFKPYCMIPAKYLIVTRELIRDIGLPSPKVSRVADGQFTDSDEAVYKLEFRIPRNVGDFRRAMSKIGCPEVYEADILFMERVMAEYDITERIRIFSDGTFEKAPDEAKIPPYVIWYWDIEVSDEFEGYEPSPKTERILAIGYVTDTSDEEVLAEEDEPAMLETFYDSIIQSVDILVGYNSDNFDEPYFRERLGQITEKPSNFRGVKFLDLGPLVINSEETTLPSWSLDYIAETKLGERKIPITMGFHETWREDRELLKERCLDDARKLKKLEDVFKYVTYALENVSLSGCPVEKVQYISYFGDGITLRESIHRCKPRVFWRCKRHSPKGDKFIGAIVREPPLGIHQRVACLDFSSLYVRIIQENWISRSSMVFEETPTTIHCGTDPRTNQEIYYDVLLSAPVPQLLMRLEQDRNRYLDLLQKETDETLRSRYDMLQKQRKISGNAMYGFTGDAKTRYFYREVADSITRLARLYLTEAITLLDNLGFEVIYADTDGIYIKFAEDTTYATITDVCNSLVPLINDLCANIAEDRNVPAEKRRIEIKFEAIYDPIIFFRSEKGAVAKKRYVAREVYSYKAGGLRTEPKVDDKGIETRRGDRSELTHIMQAEVVNFLLRGDIHGAFRYIKDMRRRFFLGELDNRAVLSSSVTKPDDEYKTKPPHFRAAQKAKAQGERLMWGKVRYVYVEDARNGLVVEPVIGDKIPPVKASGREFFWEKRIIKWCKRIMGAVVDEYEFERKMSSTSQLDAWLT